ncbi:MAG TPA: SDR family NAD(P)-dependent oxidoreductase [Sphingomonas sp.]|jgi:NAD(P)-dependent dehydrogenase (short-subunit alcohol dehydrogenase family)|uniref:SDR family NAD(P)-dependent oxidoreductase n=1 Tax=Sphingomonas sp. TaxID=28214 RepID=UPI002EDBB7CE
MVIASGETAIVIGATGGIGAALVAALEADGTRVHAFARGNGNPIDILDEASVAAAAARVADGPPPRLVIVATGMLHEPGIMPERSLRDLDTDRLARSYAVNAIGPALVAKHFLPLLPRDGRSVFAALGARVGSIGDNRLGGWTGYRMAKAALAMLIRNLAIETTRRAPGAICVALHPGTVETGLSLPFRRNLAEGQLTAPADAAANLLRVIAALTPADSGNVLAWDGQTVAP